jgi:hypothetical protein
MFPGRVVSLCGDNRFDPVRFVSLGLPQGLGIPTSSPNFGRS